MSRSDWTRGRYSSDQETEQILQGMAGWQDKKGDVIECYWLDVARTRSIPCAARRPESGRVY